MSDPGPEAVAVAVFGSSEPAEGEPLYQLAREVGRRLALAGFTVVTGGYGGVMEAASRGAREAGGATVGITARALAPLRSGPNPYLTLHVEADDLFDRTRELMRRSAGYIILPGQAGTLAELAFLWALQRARLQRRPIVLLGGFWRALVAQVESLGLVEETQLALTHVVDTPEEAVAKIREMVG